jgi:two-component system, OmpR family, sensor histidine kinase QseC
MKTPLYLDANASLRRRLLRLIFLATLAIWMLAAGLSYRQARHEVDEMMDAHMAQTASLLLADATQSSTHMGDLPALMSAMQGLRRRDKALAMEFEISRANGGIVARSAQAPALPTITTPSPGFSYLTLDEHTWRALLLTTADGTLRIQMLQAQNTRNKEALEIAVKTVVPLILIVPLLLIAIYLAIRRGLHPLKQLADEVGARSPDNLRDVPMADTPAEVLPLVSALNRLLRRVAQSLDNERRFTADAAHELRTPLAAIRIQAQVALASLEPDAHRHALNQVLAGTARATRLVEQLLRLARLDPLARLTDTTPLDMAALAASAVSDAQAQADARQSDITLSASTPAPHIAGDAQLLGIALRNVVENALRHTPPGTHITVFATLDNGDAVIGVRDTGPGVTPDELPLLIERFYRSQNNTSEGSEGSGLGLAIVRRIAELHGAQLEIGNRPEGGFEARLRWDSVRVRA